MFPQMFQQMAAAANSRAKCSICNKANTTYVCPGCSKGFCFQHLTEHRQILGNQLEEIINNHDQLQQTIVQQKQNPLNSSLIQRISQWETDSIHKIQQTAEECRKTLTKLTQKSIDDVEKRFSELSQKLKETREENEFNEIDLNHFQLKLTQITEELNGSSKISIRQDSQEFIKKISVISSFAKQATTNTNPKFSFGSTGTSAANTNSTFSFGSSNKPVFDNSPKFTFSDLAQQTPTNDGKPTSSGIEQRVFAGQGSLVFGTGATNITTTGNNHEDDDGDGSGEDDSHMPPNAFKPIVKLSAVEVKTGEEDENILFCERAKLCRFDAKANQMKERGTGEIKILQHKTTKIYRILMRREQVLNLCANHQITSQIELKPHQGSRNTYAWPAMDFVDGEGKHETLCIRFQTGEQTKNFAEVFNEAKEMSFKKSDDLPLVGKISLTDEIETTANDDDVISISEPKPSAEQIDRAKELQSPSTFSLHENKEPCKGFPGCKEDTLPVVSNDNKTATTNATKIDTKTTGPQISSTAPASASKTPLNSSENIKFSFGNADKSQIQKQTSTTKDDKTSVESPSSSNSNTTSQYDNKPCIFGSFNGSSSIFGSSTPLNNTNGSIFGGNTSSKPSNNATSGFAFPGFGGGSGAATTPSNGFQFPTPTAIFTTTTTTTTTTTNTNPTFSFGSTNKPLIDNSPKFSFSDLSKQTSTNANGQQ
ncbi:unnamed protein product [Adineta steineri]|uniref:RanBD1 domain-containing protein n=1 Tax=Adineta steineri TaxID=433720 RepID=A0A819DVX3_9BILA|nr:unnamed protein product [Adineta steineri]CAF3840034.1 unnamed protein product [Adineta steineri]